MSQAFVTTAVPVGAWKLICPRFDHGHVMAGSIVGNGQLVAQGLTSAEIGTAIWIKEDSVKQALKRMFRKLEVSSRVEMVAMLHDLLGSTR